MGGDLLKNNILTNALLFSYVYLVNNQVNYWRAQGYKLNSY